MNQSITIRTNHCDEYIATLETEAGDVEGLGETLPDALRDLANTIETAQV